MTTGTVGRRIISTGAGAEAMHPGRALDLFRGEPLSDIDLPWADGHECHLLATYVDLLQRAGYLKLGAGDARGAIQAAEQGITVDQLNEDLWRLAMNADHALGLREPTNSR